MKKTYIEPNFKVYEYQTEGIIAESIKSVKITNDPQGEKNGGDDVLSTSYRNNLWE